MLWFYGSSIVLGVSMVMCVFLFESYGKNMRRLGDLKIWSGMVIHCVATLRRFGSPEHGLMTISLPSDLSSKSIRYVFLQIKKRKNTHLKKKNM